MVKNYSHNIDYLYYLFFAIKKESNVLVITKKMIRFLILLAQTPCIINKYYLEYVRLIVIAFQHTTVNKQWSKNLSVQLVKNTT